MNALLLYLAFQFAFNITDEKKQETNYANPPLQAISNDFDQWDDGE